MHTYLFLSIFKHCTRLLLSCSCYNNDKSHMKNHFFEKKQPNQQLQLQQSSREETLCSQPTLCYWWFTCSSGLFEECQLMVWGANSWWAGQKCTKYTVIKMTPLLVLVKIRTVVPQHGLKKKTYFSNKSCLKKENCPKGNTEFLTWCHIVQWWLIKWDHKVSFYQKINQNGLQ